jgi:hypothetical protein
MRHKSVAREGQHLQLMRFKKARRLATQAAKVFLMAAMGAGTRAWCQDATNAPAVSNAKDPLVDLLIQKGILTQDEAGRVEAEAQSLRTNQTQMPPMPASVWKISQPIKSIELFGDLRTRYEDRSASDSHGNSIDLQRFRYALRFGLRGDMFEHFYYGFRMDTGANARSPFVTFGNVNNPSATAVYPGPFGKSGGGLFVGEIYIGWKPADWMDLTVGKMPNPLYTSPMVWSPNINPEGFAERFKYDVGQAQFFANFGQFLYEDLNPNSASAGLGVNGGIGQTTDNIFMLAWQGGLNYKITPALNAKVAATIYNYIGLKRSNPTDASSLSPFYGDPYVGEGAFFLLGGPPSAPGNSGFGTANNTTPGNFSVNYPLNQVGLNDLQVLEFPFEVDYKIPGRPVEARMFGDFAYNLQGGERAKQAAASYAQVQATPIPGFTPIPHTIVPQTSDVKAYQIGVGIGSDDIEYGLSQGLVYGTSSPPHSWEIRTYWQHIEQYSLDPNLLDWDFFNGLENLQGVYVAASYAFTGNVIGTFRYGHASRINDALGTGGSSGDIPQINPVNAYDIYQMDLTVRF